MTEGGFALPVDGPERRDLAAGDNWTWLRNRLLEKAADRAGGVDELERSSVWRRRRGRILRSEVHRRAGRHFGRLDRSPGLGSSRPDRHR